MSLRQLAGPFDIVDENGEPPEWFFPIMWYPGVGLILDIDFVATGVMTLDGIYQNVTQNRPNGRLSWWPARQRMLMGDDSGGGPEYVYEPKALSRQKTGPDNITGIYPYPYVRLVDRRVFVQAYGVYGCVDGISTLELELPFQGIARPGRSETDIWMHVGAETPQGCFYNTVTKTIDSIQYYLGMPCLVWCYAPEYNVFVSIHGPTLFVDPSNPWQVRVWSLEVAPFQLSDVTVVGGSIQSGQIAIFTVQVLGAQDEPCIGELVDWAISGIGTLLDTQSLTNATGAAEARVLIGVRDSGECLVTASVKC